MVDSEARAEVLSYNRSGTTFGLHENSKELDGSPNLDRWIVGKSLTVKSRLPSKLVLEQSNLTFIRRTLKGKC